MQLVNRATFMKVWLGILIVSAVVHGFFANFIVATNWPSAPAASVPANTWLTQILGIMFAITALLVWNEIKSNPEITDCFYGIFGFQCLVFAAYFLWCACPKSEFLQGGGAKEVVYVWAGLDLLSAVVIGLDVLKIGDAKKGKKSKK